MAEQEPGVGQIWIASAVRGPDVYVLVTELHDGHVMGLLCGEDCHLATDTDSVLEPRITGYPRGLLIHGDLAGAILESRLSQLIGSVDPSLVERIVLRGRGLDFYSSDLGRGRPILDESDPRWEWKLEKLRLLRRVRATASELGWHLYKLGEAPDRVA